MAESLPRMRFLLPILPQLDGVFVPGDAPPFVRESLEAMGVDPDALISIGVDSHYECEHLFVPQYSGGLAVPQWVGDFLKATYTAHGVLDIPIPTRRIYVSRARAGQRRIVNEAEVSSRLGQRGFEIVRLEDLRFIDQIRLFNEANCVIAPHGAGLSNLFFSQAGIGVYEIMPSRRVPPHIFHVITSQIGGRYHYACGTPVGDEKPRGDIDRDFMVDDALLEEILRALDRNEAIGPADSTRQLS